MEGVGGGGGSKVFDQKAPSNGVAHRCHIRRRLKSRSVPVVGGAAAIFAQPGFEPPTKRCAVSYITIRPLLACSQKFSPLLGAASTTDKKPKLCVCV